MTLKLSNSLLYWLPKKIKIFLTQTNVTKYSVMNFSKTTVYANYQFKSYMCSISRWGSKSLRPQVLLLWPHALMNLDPILKGNIENTAWCTHNVDYQWVVDKTMAGIVTTNYCYISRCFVITTSCKDMYNNYL